MVGGRNTNINSYRGGRGGRRTPNHFNNNNNGFGQSPFPLYQGGIPFTQGGIPYG
jgi:hypothetical protein